MSAETPSYDQKARRIKQLLSSYYGTDHQADVDTVSQQSGGPTDEVSSSASVGTPKYSSIDSPAFNVDTYVGTLVRTARIDTLLKTHADMVREIRALDSDMQMLVYENYNKFITATDTIRSMKSNVDGMGEKMKELKTIMGRVAETSDGVNSKLQKHRDGIEELSRVKVLLQKIQCVIDLSKRLTIALNEGAFSVAVNNYCEAKPLLKKYGHQGAFRSVASKCDAIIEDVQRKLKERLQHPTEDAEECVRLLQQLGSNSSALQDLFLSGRRQQIESFLDEASLRLSSMASALLIVDEASGSESKGPQDDNTNMRSFVASLNGQILNSLCATAADFNVTFSATDHQSDATLDRSHLLLMSRRIMDAYKQRMSQALAITVIQGARRALDLPSRGMISLPSNFTDEDKCAAVVTVGDDYGVAEVTKHLSNIASDLSMVECRLPELEPVQISSFLSRSCIEYHITICFRALVHRVIGTLICIKKKALNSQVSSGTILRGATEDFQDERIYAYMCDLLLKGVASILEDLKRYETNGLVAESWSGDFNDALQGQIHMLFTTLLNGFLALVKNRNPENETAGSLFREIVEGIGLLPLPSHVDENRLCDLAETGTIGKPQCTDDDSMRSRHRTKCPSGVVLLCARLCAFLEISLVPHAVEMMASMFHGAGNYDQPAFNPSEIIRKSNTCASALLRVYVELYSRSLTLVIRQSIAAANWVNHKEPRGPRPICDLIIARLETSEKEIVQLVDDGGNRSRRNLNVSPKHNRSISAASVDASESAEGTALERNVAKLFRERTQVGRKAEFTQSSIQAAILGGGLKSLIECVRLETIGRAGLQQLQLDVLYLRPMVGGFVRGKESETIGALLEEVIAAAVDRSLDPTLLEPAVVEKILMSEAE